MTETFSNDLKAVELDCPAFFEWKGRYYIGQRTPIVEGFEMADSGLIQKFDFSMLVRLSQFTEPPVINDVITITDTTKPGRPRTNYRIERIEPSQDGVAATFSCVEAV